MKKTVSIAIATLALLSSSASANADVGSVQVASPTDLTGELSDRSLARMARILERRGRDLGEGRRYFLTPSVTTLDTSVHGSRAVVSCSVKVVVTRVTSSAIDTRAAVITTSARVYTRTRRAKSARSKCVAGAADAIDGRRFAGL